MNPPFPSPLQPITRFLLRWGPSLLWAIVIFGNSTDAMSAAHTSRFFEPLLRWLCPGISDPTVGFLHTMIRKAAHLGEYAILALLLRSAIEKPAFQPGRRFRWKSTAIVIVVATLYAAGDEFHQSLVPSRGASVTDVLLDMCGATVGLAMLIAANGVAGVVSKARALRG